MPSGNRLLSAVATISTQKPKVRDQVHCVKILLMSL